MRALKLNLGCGNDKRKGYINVDVDPRLKPDVIHDLLKPLPFEDTAASEIVLQDVLEHLTKEQAIKLLTECVRVLKKNGTLMVRVPNVDKIYQKYRSQPDLMMLFLYGDTSLSGTWGAHKYGYAPRLLSTMVNPLGLVVFSAQTIDTNYQFVLKKKKVALKTVVAKSLVGYVLCTIVRKSENKQVVWKIKHKYPKIISKFVLRPLSKRVDHLYVDSQVLANWVQRELQFSHLRIMVSSL